MFVVNAKNYISIKLKLMISFGILTKYIYHRIELDMLLKPDSFAKIYLVSI
jgi:DNA-binding MltR family transcriptional regulator